MKWYADRTIQVPGLVCPPAGLLSLSPVGHTLVALQVLADTPLGAMARQCWEIYTGVEGEARQNNIRPGLKLF